MCNLLEHRGPDGAGYYIRDGVALGHRRLSIIDIDGGWQPLGNEDGSVQVVFNGEIYNYLEHRQELEKKGHRFRTKSDTEVLAHLYEELGERMPEQLNGMFAFALWDQQRGQLLLGRDRLGKKPLYYTDPIGGIGLAFASELKALAGLPGFDRSPRAQSIADFLALSYVPDPHSVYERAHKLEPGHSLRVEAGGSIRRRRYWKLEYHPENNLGEAEAGARLLELSQDAVKRRMISDVPLGAFLSGGVDSSAVVGLMAEVATGPVKTFSIGFRERAYDELEYARLVADRCRSEHHEQVVSPAIEEIFDTLVYQFDEPFADSSAIPMMYLARMTRQHVTVALSGDGADELLAGYRLYRFGMVESRLRRWIPNRAKGLFRWAGEHYPKLDWLPRPLRAQALMRNLGLEIAEAHFHSRSNFSPAGLARLLSKDLPLDGYRPLDRMRQEFGAVAGLGPLEQMQAVDIATYLPGDILVKADRATMAYSLEARAPFLDYRIAELSGILRSDLKLRGRTGKYLLKKALSRYVPEPLIKRAKMGFSVPMAQWMRGALKPVFECALRDRELARYLNPNEVRRLWNEHQSGFSDHSRPLWAILMLYCWDQRHRRSQPVQPPLRAS
jgi:asparagine synthase (glutamine-hydrolysing)